MTVEGVWVPGAFDSGSGFASPWTRKDSIGLPIGSPRWAAGERPAVDSDDPPRRDVPIDIDALVQANLTAIVGGLLIVVVALGFAVVGLIRRVRRLSRRLESITQGSDEQSLEAVLGSHLERVQQVVRDVDDVSARAGALERHIEGAFTRVGLVRFNPFEDTGGNQSFALALLDGRGDGFVVSSLHARAGTRVYAKAVAGGASEATLSDEEAAALKQALAKPGTGSGG